MQEMIDMFVASIDPSFKIVVDGNVYQYNTVDSEGWTYWKELGRGNDLGLLLKSVDDINDEVTVEFHSGKTVVIKHKFISPLLSQGV